MSCEPTQSPSRVRRCERDAMNTTSSQKWTANNEIINAVMNVSWRA